ncbi:MAG: gliding motility-associated C-terminal domain-containing protein [Bacteroidota bacterium]
MFFLIFLNVTTYSQVFYNNGCDIYFNNSSIIKVTGTAYNNNSGTIDNLGTCTIDSNFVNNATAGGDGMYKVSGDWENNQTFNSGTGDVILEGADQLITGTAITTFYDLELTGSGIKTQTLDSYVSDTLNLNDMELATDSFIMFITNTDTDAIIRTSGFVSSLGNGCLSRATANNSIYLFPVGSSFGTTRYRPVEITPALSNLNTYTVRMANDDATNEGYGRSLLDTGICLANPYFFHKINRTAGTDIANITIFYDETDDGPWEGIANWKSSILQWEDIDADTAITGSPLNSIAKYTWDDFTDDPYILTAPSPNIDLGPDTLFCMGIDTLVLDAGYPGSNYLWQDGSGNQAFVVDTSGTYYVEVTIPGGCTATDTIVVNVLTSYLSVADTSICPGDSIFAGGSWQNNTGTYYDSLTSSAGCDSIFTTNLTVLTIMSSTIDTGICQGDSIFLGGAYQNSTGIYYDSLLSVAGCDSIIVTTTLSVNPTTSSPVSVTICSNDSVFMEGAWQDTPGIYYDTLPSVTLCDSVIVTTLSVNPAFSIPVSVTICGNDSVFLEGNWQNTAGIYYDTFSSIDGCDSVIVTTLTVHPAYSTPVSATICGNDSVFLEGAWQNTPGTYYDAFSSIDGCDSIIVTTLTVTTYSTPVSVTICGNDSVLLEGAWQTTPGTYYDTLLSIAGCDSVIITTLAVNAQSDATINPAGPFCANDAPVTLIAFEPSGAWSGNGITDIYAGTFDPDIAGSGTWQVVYIIAGSCGDTGSINIVVNPTPGVNAGSNVNIILGESTNFNATGGVTYTWTPTTGLSCTNCQGPEANPNETTTYTVTVIDNNGCSGSDSLTVFVDIFCGEVWVPNAFSPNNDGENDELKVYGDCIGSMTFEIYDRWGEKVFESSSPSDSWDGTLRGKAMNKGVFVYYLDATLFNNETVKLTGNISLIR